MAEAPLPLPPDLPARYQPLAALGAGGFGAVWRCLDRELDREVAVKLLRSTLEADEARARFVREAKATAAVRHPAVVQVLDHGVARGGAPFLVYELVVGPDLETWLAREGAAPWEPLARWGETLAGALQAIHDAGLVHRDVKPANVLLDPTSGPRLCDLGIALRPGGDTVVTAAGLILGTPAYMAPEVLMGRQAAGPAADQYGLAATLYRAAYGAPVHGGDLAEILARHARGAAPEFPRRDPDRQREARFQALIRRGLAADPGDRFASAGELGGALAALAIGGEPAAEARAHAPARTVLRAAPAPGAGKAASEVPPRRHGSWLVPAALVAMLGAVLLSLGVSGRHVDATTPGDRSPGDPRSEPPSAGTAATPGQDQLLAGAMERLGALLPSLDHEYGTAPADFADHLQQVLAPGEADRIAARWHEALQAAGDLVDAGAIARRIQPEADVALLRLGRLLRHHVSDLDSVSSRLVTAWTDPRRIGLAADLTRDAHELRKLLEDDLLALMPRIAAHPRPPASAAVLDLVMRHALDRPDLIARLATWEGRISELPEARDAGTIDAMAMTIERAVSLRREECPAALAAARRVGPMLLARFGPEVHVPGDLGSYRLWLDLAEKLVQTCGDPAWDLVAICHATWLARTGLGDRVAQADLLHRMAQVVSRGEREFPEWIRARIAALGEP